MGSYENINITVGGQTLALTYNPVHAIWWCLLTAGLPESWLDSTSFLAAATTVFNEGKGIQLNMRDHQPCLTYLKNLLTHIDGILYYGVNGKLNIKLIRNDYTVGNLPVVTEAEMMSDPVVERGSWLQTTGEIQVQYNELTVDTTYSTAATTTT